MTLAKIDRDIGHRDLITELGRIYKPNSYLGVGVQEGGSIIALLKGHHPQVLFMCDTWGGESGGTNRGNHHRIEKLLRRLLFNGAQVYLNGRSQVLLQYLRGRSFDIVHIDGSHTEEDAYNDLCDASWLAKKLIVVHDWKLIPSVAKALEKFDTDLFDSKGHWDKHVYHGDHGTVVYEVLFYPSRRKSLYMR